MKNDKCHSDALTVNKGLPQGSMLGPVFFSLYINDIVNISSSFTPILYADDTTLLFRNNNETELQQVCNCSIVQFQNWSIAIRITININNEISFNETSFISALKTLQFFTYDNLTETKNR